MTASMLTKFTGDALNVIESSLEHFEQASTGESIRGVSRREWPLVMAVSVSMLLHFYRILEQSAGSLDGSFGRADEAAEAALRWHEVARHTLQAIDEGEVKGLAVDNSAQLRAAYDDMKHYTSHLRNLRAAVAEYRSGNSLSEEDFDDFLPGTAGSHQSPG